MLKQLIGILLLACLGSSAQAAYPADPFALINEAANRTFDRLNQDQQKIHSEPGYLRVVIRDELMPYVDNKFAAYKVIGSNIKETTPAQRDRFTLAFTDYIIATYADALAKYDQQKIKVESPRDLGDDKVVSVNVAVLDPGKPDINVIFKLRQNNKTGEWKAFDMVAEGISLLSSKQSELGGMIRDKGIDAVSQMLEEHNKKPAQLPGKKS
ncbi:phospholipid-binding protein MlaC [Pseudaeromonas pectinilytica]|jgi:phospholipid transport system substrate-binding protein|nr:phospholipid-binding protein MlaC [Aeromonadaceae bacterium]MBP8771976.1 phospholipid-binding protein MlaC [Aeromonadaceae bacterium]